MSQLYGGPRPASAASIRGAALTSAPPPRFEFGMSVLARPAQFTSMTLRTQPHAYPHHAPGTSDAPPLKPTRPSSASLSSSSGRAAASHTPRGQSGRGQARSVVRPALEDDDVRDRYLPSTSWSSAFDSDAADSALLPHTYAHKSGSSATLTPRPPAASNVGVEGRARTQGQLRVDGGGASQPRDFMASPAYLAFLAQREETERATSEEMGRREADVVRSNKGASSARRYTAPSTSESPGDFTPTIPYPARSSTAHAASAASAAIAAAAQPVSSAVRVPTALGLHTRTLDALQLLSSLRAELDRSFELVRIDEKRRRRQEQRAAQRTLKDVQQHVAQAQAQSHTASAPAGMQFLQAGSISVPNMPNVTSTTLALLAHTPAHSKRASAPTAAALSAAASAPTFLTDAEVESHALGNLTAAQRARVFGGAHKRSSAAGESEEKEASTYPDADPTSDRRSTKKLGASSMDPHTGDALPADVAYTADMCAAFEESVRHWGEFLLASASTASPANSSALPNGAAVNPNADLILVLQDASAKYAALVRMAMQPVASPHSSGDEGEHEKLHPHHHLLPRMMESVWKLVMLVIEVAMVRKNAATAVDAADAADASAGRRRSTDVAMPAKTAAPVETLPAEVSRALVVANVASPVAAAAAASSSSLVSAGPVPSAHAAVKPFDPTSAEDRARLEAQLRTYNDSFCLTGEPTASALASGADVSVALSVQRAEAGLRGAGLYSAGLMLQRDSLLAASSRLLRENELLKLRLRESHTTITALQEQQDTALRSLARAGADTVGAALDELDEWMDDALDARRAQADSIGRTAHIAYDYAQKHAAAVQAEATADASHAESVGTLRRVQAREREIQAERRAEVEAAEAQAQQAETERAKAAAALDAELRALESMTQAEVTERVALLSDVHTLRAVAVRLLTTRLKRSLAAETPAQRAMRLRRESTPRALRTLLIRHPSERLLPLKPLARQLLELYFARMCAEDAHSRNDAASSPASSTALASAGGGALDAVTLSSKRRCPSLSVFASEWMQARFGLRAIADNNLSELLRSVLVYLHPERPSSRRFAASLALNSADMVDRSARLRLALFARLCPLYADAPLPPEALEFFLYTLRVTQEAAQQSLPSSHPCSLAHAASGANVTTAEAAKIMLRALEAACVPISAAGAAAMQAALQASSKLSRRGSMPKDASAQLSAALRSASTAATSDDSDSDVEGSGSIALHVPLFLALEAAAHSFRQLGYTDEASDRALAAIERECVWPLQGPSARGVGEAVKQRALLRHVIARQMVRTAGMGLASSPVAGAISGASGPTAPASLAAVFDRFDSERSGRVGLAQLRAQMSMDDETAAQLAVMLDAQAGSASTPAGSSAAPASGNYITLGDLQQALSPEYRLAVPLDLLLERAINAWLDEHRALTERYAAACAEAAGPQGQGLLSLAEWSALLARLELTVSTPLSTAAAGSAGTSAAVAAASSRITRAFCSRTFKDAVELDRKAAEAQQVAETQAAARKEAALSKKKNRRRGGRASSPSPPPLTRTLSRVAPADASTPGADGASGVAASSASSPSPSPLSRGASHARTSSLPPEFITVASALTMLRRHRIGLAPRKVVSELKAFCRRAKLVAAGAGTMVSNSSASGSASSTTVAATVSSAPAQTLSSVSSSSFSSSLGSDGGGGASSSLDTILMAIIEE